MGCRILSWVLSYVLDRFLLLLPQPILRLSLRIGHRFVPLSRSTLRVGAITQAVVASFSRASVSLGAALGVESVFGEFSIAGAYGANWVHDGFILHQKQR